MVCDWVYFLNNRSCWILSHYQLYIAEKLPTPSFLIQKVEARKGFSYWGLRHKNLFFRVITHCWKKPTFNKRISVQRYTFVAQLLWLRCRNEKRVLECGPNTMQLHNIQNFFIFELKFNTRTFIDMCRLFNRSCR